MFKWTLPAALVAVTAMAVCLYIGTSRSVSAGVQTFQVNLTVDVVDASIADGVCDIDTGTAGEQCTLRAAIQQANSTLEADLVRLGSATYTLTIPRGATDFDTDTEAGDLDVTHGLRIEGQGARTTIIDANGFVTNSRAFEIDDDIDDNVPAGLTMVGLTILGGGPSSGSARFDGGGIRAAGPLHLERVEVNFNSGRNGGSIYSYRSLTIIDSTIAGNAELNGGAIYSSGPTIILTSTFPGSAASGGGSIWNTGGLTIHSTTITNSAAVVGGGIYNLGGTVQISNSTIAGNHATENGGGVETVGLGPVATVHLFNVTITGNWADWDDNGVGVGGGVLIGPNASMTMLNSIIGDNLRKFGGIFPIDDDCSGTLTSWDYNLVKETAGCTIQDDGPTVIKGVSPMLGNLADNGGMTQTTALQQGSPAIDGGNPVNGCTDEFAFPLLEDQRGYLRPVDGDGNGSAICDLGAYEFGAPIPTPTPSSLPTPTPTPTASPMASATPTPTTTPTPTGNPTPTLSPTPTPMPEDYLQGDVDCDDDVDSVDSLKILRHVADLSVQQADPCPEIGSEVASLFGDVGCDNDVDSVDALFILRYVAFLPVNQPQGCPEIGA